jgi:hypothetical protein
LGKNLLTEPHSLNSFKLAQGAIKVSLEAQPLPVSGNVHDVHGVSLLNKDDK